jgi:hypothetical protein
MVEFALLNVVGGKGIIWFYIRSKDIGLVEVEIHLFLNSALIEGEWSVWRPGRLLPREGTRLPTE